MSEVAKEEYDSLMYVKPEGELLFNAAFVDGYPTRHKPDIVIIELLGRDGVPGPRFNAVFSNNKFRASPLRVEGSGPTIYEKSDLVKNYKQDIIYYKEGWADWISHIRQNDCYEIYGTLRKLKIISIVPIPDAMRRSVGADDFVEPVVVLLSFSKVR